MNFNEVLNMKAGEIERPPLLPQGTYRGRVSKIPSFDTVGKEDEWDIVDFPMLLIEPLEDVDSAELEKAGGLNKGSVRRVRFMFNKNDKAAFDKTLYRMKRFLIDHLQIPDANDDTSLKELLNNSLNAECACFIKWNPDKNDKELQYDEISKTAPLS